jgi:hypothetical protein
MQKTLTVNGKRFNGKQIEKLMTNDNMTVGGDYIVMLNNKKYFANFRQMQDNSYAPVCDKSAANVIALMPGNTYYWDIWVKL